MSLAIWAALPAAFGWTTTVVMTGSMAPAIMPGDAVVVRPVPVEELVVGQIVLAHDPDHEGRLRLHRIAEIQGDVLVLRGDANQQNDSSPVARESVVGVGALRIPGVGIPALLVHDQSWILAVVLIGGAVALVWLAGVDTKSRDAEEDNAGLSVVWTTGLGIVTAALLMFTALTPTAGASFMVTTDAGPNSLSTIPYYTCDAAILAASPYVYFRFDETSATTTATDSSGNGRNGSYRGTVTKNQPRACLRDSGTAVRLNGSSGYVRTKNSVLSAPGTYTISMWFQTTSTTGGRLLGFGNQRTNKSSTFDRHVYLTSTGQVTFGANPGKTTISSITGGYNDGQWHHFAATQSPAGMALYVDGVLQGSNTQAASAPYSGYWRVGWDNLQGWPGFPAATNYYIRATIDNAVVYTTALTAAQVSAQYLAGK